MVKLIYTNEYGQIVHSDSSYYVSSEDEKNSYEEYPTMEEAAQAANTFVEKYPIMSCLLYPSDSDEEIIISARKEELVKALKAKKLENKKLALSTQRKTIRQKYISIVVIISLLALIFMLKM